MPIGIMAAMQEEIDRLLRELPAGSEVVNDGRRTYHSGHLWGTPVVIVFSRWGKVAAATTATDLISDFCVTEILFTGVAGAAQPGLKVGDIVVGARLWQHDMDARPLFPRHEIPLLGRSSFASDEKRCDQLLQAAAAHLATDYDNRGVAYANKGLYDQAIEDFNQAISLLPKSFPAAYFNRGSAYGNQSLDDQAIADFTMAISLEPGGAGPDFKLADAYDYRGNAYERKGLYDEAIADFTVAISLNPRLEGAYANRGNDYLRKGQYDLAIADFGMVISFDPRNVASRFNRALAYQHKGLYDDAIADFTKVISLASADAGAYDARGLAYAHNGLYDQAIADYTKEIALNAKDIQRYPVFARQYANAYVHRADAYGHKGLTDAAVADYREALKLDPVMQPAKDALARLGAVP